MAERRARGGASFRAFPAVVVVAVAALLGGGSAEAEAEASLGTAAEQKWSVPSIPFFSAGPASSSSATTTAESGHDHGHEHGRYSCRTSKDEDVMHWSKRRQEWCCKHSRVACAPGEGGHDGHAGAHAGGRHDGGRSRSSSSSSATSGKSSHAHATTTLPTTSTTLFNCVAGFADWETAWSHEKQKDCCQRFQRGCPTDRHKATTTTAQVDCEGSRGAQATWSPERRALCCHRAGRGCSSHDGDHAARSTERPDGAGSTTASPGTTSARSGSGGSRGSNSTGVTFDCLTDALNWEWSWSKAKQQWCCERQGRGCIEEASGAWKEKHASFECDIEFEQWELSWSPLKKEWCCENAARGCPPAAAAAAETPAGSDGFSAAAAVVDVVVLTTSLPYDCGRGLARWRATWPEGKKAWCCKNKGVGCPTSSESVAAGSQPRPLEAVQQQRKQQPQQLQASTTATATTTTATATTTTATATATTATATTTTATATATTATATATTATATTTTATATTTTATATTTTARRYDCDQDFENWLTLWDVDKRVFCCNNKPLLAGHAMCFNRKFQEGGRAERAAVAASSSSSSSASALLAGSAWKLGAVSGCAFLAACLAFAGARAAGLRGLLGGGARERASARRSLRASQEPMVLLPSDDSDEAPSEHDTFV